MSGGRRWIAAVLTLLLASAAVAGTDDHVIADELKAVEDPSIMKRRVWVDTEWSSFRDSSNELDFTFGALWAWRSSASRDWGLRIKVPMNSHMAGDTVGDTNEVGLGDIKVAAGTAFRFSKTFRAAVGLEMRFPTAQDDLGSNAWRPQLFGTVAWDATRAITFSPSVEYNKSIKELRGSAPQEFMEVFLPVTFLLPQRWSVAPRYEYKVDFANNDLVTRSAKLTVTKALEDRPLGFSLSYKQNIDQTSKKFQVNFLTTYYFR